MTGAALWHQLATDETEPSTEVLCLDAPDGAPLWCVPQASDALVDAAVRQGRAAATAWGEATWDDRAGALLGAAAALVAGREEIAHDLVLETGKPIAQARGEVDRSALVLRDYAARVFTPDGTVLLRYAEQVWGFEAREPAGLAAIVIPWNLPLQIAAVKVGAALAAGCPVVVKPSPLAPRSPMRLIDALRAGGLPEGTATLVHGVAATGRALVQHPLVRVVSFTGSTGTGRAVMADAAGGPKKVLLELGGKSANIVFADAELDRAVDGVVTGLVRNQGATCTAATRLLLERPVFDAVVGRLAERIDGIRVGDPFLDETVMGAVRTDELAGSFERAVADARGRGAVLHAGGTPIAVPGRTGAYFAPTLLSGLPNDDELAREELFGPVLLAVPFDDEAEALRLANDNPYGLAAGVWSADGSRIERMWRRLDVGTVYLNSYNRIAGIPLAAEGRKGSGFGAEGGAAGIAEFTTTKSVHAIRHGF